MLTLSNGFKKPETGDKGSIFFAALEDNIDQVNSHSHNGTDSEKLSTISSNVLTSDVLAASWAADGNTYKQSIIMPAGIVYDNVTISYKEAVTHEIAHLKTVKTATDTFDVYCNDSTKSFKAVYSS